MAVPDSWPGYHASIAALTLEIHGIVTAEPVFSTTTVLAFTAATALIRLFCVAPRSMSARSEPSDSYLLAKTPATSALLAPATAWSCSDWPGTCQPRVAFERLPDW